MTAGNGEDRAARALAQRRAAAVRAGEANVTHGHYHVLALEIEDWPVDLRSVYAEVLDRTLRLPWVDAEVHGTIVEEFAMLVALSKNLDRFLAASGGIVGTGGRPQVVTQVAFTLKAEIRRYASELARRRNRLEEYQRL